VHVEVALQGFEARDVRDPEVNALLGTPEFLKAGDAVVFVGRQVIAGRRGKSAVPGSNGVWCASW
jgi:hypothetical protein